MTITEARQLIQASSEASNVHATAVNRFMETEGDEDYRALCDAEKRKSYAEYMAGDARTYIRRTQATTCQCGQVWVRGSAVNSCDECR